MPLTVKSTCPYCGVGCGVSVERKQNDSVQIGGDQNHPANYGRLCSKGSALAETLTDESRLRQPMVAGAEVSWKQATSLIANKISDSIEQHGADSVAFYLSGQLLTEDYYVANKLIKGYLGTANIDTNSRLCMASAVAGYKRAFGSDTVPCSYADLEHAQLIVLIGSNAAWTHPVLYQRMVAAKQARPDLRIVLIDPRVTASAQLADLHLQITPSSDGFLFQGLLHYLIAQEATDLDYITQHTNGFAQAKTDVEHIDLATVSANTGVDQLSLTQFYSWFAEHKKVVSFYSQGINQSATGTDKCNAIINCHLATAKLGYVGAGPFSITGQPNAMGGREVGGLANQLAAHMDFSADDRDRVQRFWQSPTIATKPGLKAVELFDAVSAGQIKVIWIMATNPAVSLPATGKVRQALEACDTVIVSDVTQTDTTAYADILLPALAWGEKDGTVTNSERCISRQRGFRAAPGESRADWWAITQVAQKLGFTDAFAYTTPQSIFTEHAGLSGFENNGTRDFDISGFSDLSESEYDALVPVQWPVITRDSKRIDTPRFFAQGGFYTPDKKANFVSNSARLSDSLADKFLLNTGRIRDQWHTMSRTGLAATLSGHSDSPFIQINPADANQLGLVNDQFARLFCDASDMGDYIARVAVSSDVSQGELFSPIHWNSSFATNATIADVVSAEVDPVSGQPELKASMVLIEPFACQYWARIASKEPILKTGWRYWSQVKTRRGYLTLLGTNEEFDWRELAPASSQLVEYAAKNDKQLNLLASNSNKGIEMLIYVHGQAELLPSFSWLSALFDADDASQLPSLLRAEQGVRDKLICGCFQVSEKAIKAAQRDGAANVEQLSERLGCGAKCGSCKPELAALMA